LKPAVTKTVTRRVVKTPAQTQERVIPAVTKQITRRVVDQPARTERREIPARYETVTVQKMVEAPRTETIVIPAEYGTIDKRTVITPEKAEWRQVLCEANANSTVISAIQGALKTQGFYQGRIDGRLGQATYSAVEQFQRQRGMSTGGLTLRTVDALGVDWRSASGGADLSSNGEVFGSAVRDGRNGGTSSGSMSAGGFSVRADGSVVDSRGVTVGRVDGSGQIISATGQVIGRVTPQN